MAIDDQKQINQSVARITRNLIESDLGIQDSIARDYANISGIARLLKPKIEKMGISEVNEDAIITAVKRIVPKYTSINNEITDKTINVIIKGILMEKFWLKRKILFIFRPR